MGRRAKPAKGKGGAKRPLARKSSKDVGAKVRDPQKLLAESLKREKAKDRALAEALEQQTATAEILRVISSTHADAQPVFDTIVQSAVRLCNAANAAVFLTDGRMVYHPANYGSAPEALAAVRAQFPRPLDRSTAPGMAILTRSVVQVPDIEDPSALEAVRQGGRLLGFRSVITVPMLRESEPVGALGVARREPGQFSDAEVGLLTTFADQAVIAIENVRLFRELEARNQDLTESLERQTATAEILSVISASPTDLRPVFDAILQSALRLCRAVNGGIWRLETGVLSPVAFAGSRSPEWDALARGIEPIPPRREMVSGWAVLEGQVLSVPDIEADDRFPNAQRLAQTMGIRSVLGVPMLREGVAVGAMVLNKMEPAGFGERQIDLVRTFADQAVIAIENVRLFKELEARNRDLTEALTRQTATSEILRVISSSPTDAQPVFDAIARNAVVLCGGIRALVLRFDGERLHVAGHYNMSLDVVDRVGQAFPRHPGREYPPDQALLDRSVVHVPDLQAATEFAASTAWQRGVRSLLAVPLLREQEAVGVISLARDVVGPFSPPQIEVLQTFADQAVIAIENVRLFNELEAANRGLRSASQHKSEFLANMSHELRTPLNAVIGFSEVLTERMFGELNEKQDEYLRDIYASGQHLLSLINDILDLSKIEAGRMELELADFHLPSAVENALILVRERASRRGIALGHTIDSGLGMVRADERKVKQVLLNLLSNAIKFTPEGGRIDVRAALHDDHAEISVADTGAGIAPEDQEAVFEEFRQVGTAAKKVEGTGLGLALSRKFVELHGGRIWVQSQVGEGSTFTFTLPVRREEEMGA